MSEFDFERIKVNNKFVGIVYKIPGRKYPWGAEAKNGLSWDSIDTREEAIDLLAEEANISKPYEVDIRPC